MTKRTKKDYTTEFKDRAVSLVLKSDKPTAQIARDLGVTGTTLYSWVNNKKRTHVQEDGATTSNYSTS
ncbi:MAG: transposase [Pseudomonadales bacterium]|nr:transposase [Pseudomonadales bacterium]